jgi:LysR family cys regulon transcriptional activator
MNLQQLRVIRETVRSDYNLTEAANALFTSQSGVSRQIKELENEIGLELFVRRGRRFVGLTGPGKELFAIVERIMLDADTIKRLGAQFSGRDDGELTIATTHTQARYVLPSAIAGFRRSFPKVRLVLRQASSDGIASMLLAGDADIGIATEGLQQIAALATFPYKSWHHAVIVPVGHPLTRLKSLSLEDLAKWPLITYTEGLTGRRNIDQAFADAGLQPDIVMSALDADVIKAYVELGLGVGIIAAMAFDSRRDVLLRMLRCDHLFEGNVSRIAIRHGHYLRGYAYRFIEQCAPDLSESAMRAAVKTELWDADAISMI